MGHTSYTQLLQQKLNHREEIQEKGALNHIGP
jgi:hypothetical protein